jgi:hypothetical protein
MFFIHVKMLQALASFILSSTVSAVILCRSPWINTEPEYLLSKEQVYPEFDILLKIVCVYLIFDRAATWDYWIHHNINVMGILWCYIVNNYCSFMNNILMFEMSTPFLNLYFMTKNPVWAPFIIVTYAYYRIYNCIVHFYYIGHVDNVITCVHTVNTALNFYWFTKILIKYKNFKRVQSVQ